MQFGGSNYLIPVDITADSERQVADESIPLQRILDDLTEQKARFSLAIIDACRSNPFKEAGRALGGRGLASVTPATGQMIMFSAGAGQAALDNLGPKDPSPNGVFTRVLIEHMRMPGVPAGSLLKDVQSDVVDLARSVNHEQVPALYDQSLGKFYFRPGAPGVAAAGGSTLPVSAAIHVPSAAQLDESYWQGIRSSTDATDFQGYTKSFPKGMHSAEAEMMTRKLTRSAAAKPAPAAPDGGSAVAATPGRLAPGGPFQGSTTSNLLPGQLILGSLMVNKDGTIDGFDSNGGGGSSHVVINVANPNHVYGTQAVHLGKVNGIQFRYPDGSTDTMAAFEGKLSNGVITGTWHDKFQSGQFTWTVGPPH